MERWHRLPRELVESPPLEILKTWLDMAQSNLLYLTLLVQWDWARWSPEVTSSLNHSVFLWCTTNCLSLRHCICKLVQIVFFFLRHKLPDVLGDSSPLVICPLFRYAAFCLGSCARNAIAFFDSWIQQRYLNIVAGDAFQQLNTKGF